MQLTSPDFKNNETLPAIFTCDGDGANPTLIIDGAPTAAKSLVLIVDDPDAPSGNFVHWIMWNIPADTKIIPQNKTPQYIPPCPPSGTHRYFFKIFALDTVLNLDSSADKSKLLVAMNGHVVDTAELIGLYKKK